MFERVLWNLIIIIHCLLRWKYFGKKKKKKNEMLKNIFMNVWKKNLIIFKRSFFFFKKFLELKNQVIFFQKVFFLEKCHLIFKLWKFFEKKNWALKNYLKKNFPEKCHLIFKLRKKSSPRNVTWFLGVGTTPKNQVTLIQHTLHRSLFSKKLLSLCLNWRSFLLS